MYQIYYYIIIYATNITISIYYKVSALSLSIVLIYYPLKPDLVEKLLSVDMFPGPIPERLMPDFKRFMSTISNIQFKGHSLSEVKSNASKDLEIAMPVSNKAT